MSTKETATPTASNGGNTVKSENKPVNTADKTASNDVPPMIAAPSTNYAFNERVKTYQAGTFLNADGTSKTTTGQSTDKTASNDVPPMIAAPAPEPEPVFKIKKTDSQNASSKSSTQKTQPVVEKPKYEFNDGVRTYPAGTFLNADGTPKYSSQTNKSVTSNTQKSDPCAKVDKSKFKTVTALSNGRCQVECKYGEIFDSVHKKCESAYIYPGGTQGQTKGFI